MAAVVGRRRRIHGRPIGIAGALSAIIDFGRNSLLLLTVLRIRILILHAHRLSMLLPGALASTADQSTCAMSRVTLRARRTDERDQNQAADRNADANSDACARA